MCVLGYKFACLLSHSLIPRPHTPKPEGGVWRQNYVLYPHLTLCHTSPFLPLSLSLPPSLSLPTSHSPLLSDDRLQMMKERDRRMAPDSEWIARQQAMRDNLPLNYNAEDIQRRVDEVSVGRVK